MTHPIVQVSLADESHVPSQGATHHTMEQGTVDRGGDPRHGLKQLIPYEYR
jgi:hypothetical protein